MYTKHLELYFIQDEILKDLSERLERGNSLARPGVARTPVVGFGVDKQHSVCMETQCDGGASGAGGASSDDDSGAGDTIKNTLSLAITSTDVKSISVAKHKKSTTSKLTGRENSTQHSPINKAALTHQTMGRNTTSRGDSESHKKSRHLDRPDLAIFRARLMCQPTLPTINNTTTIRSSRRSNSRGATHSRLAEDGCDNKQVKKLKRLLATHPTLLSQSTHVKKLMDRVYTAPPASRRVLRGSAEMEMVEEGDFKWTEVFPVLKKMSDNTVRAGERPIRSVTGNGEVLLPKLTTNKGTWGTRHTQQACADTCVSSAAKAPEKANCSGRQDGFHLKLPRITH